MAMENVTSQGAEVTKADGFSMTLVRGHDSFQEMVYGHARDNSSSTYAESGMTEPSEEDMILDSSQTECRQRFGTEQSLYDLLVPNVAHEQCGILFGWWPRSRAWSRAELVERTTRCLPAVRPNVDRVALPNILEVHELWEAWVNAHGLKHSQAVWFPPLLEADAVSDPASATCRAVLEMVLGDHSIDRPCFYPMYVTQEVVEEAAFHNLHIIGDLEQHELMPLSSAKAWMHPHVANSDSGVAMSSLRTALPSTLKARGPYGYVASSSDELRTAWVRLQQECPPGTQLVLKPASGSGGCGVILDAQEADLEKLGPQLPSAVATVVERQRYPMDRGAMAVKAIRGFAELIRDFLNVM